MRSWWRSSKHAKKYLRHWLIFRNVRLDLNRPLEQFNHQNDLFASFIKAAGMRMQEKVSRISGHDRTVGRRMAEITNKTNYNLSRILFLLLLMMLVKQERKKWNSRSSNGGTILDAHFLLVFLLLIIYFPFFPYTFYYLRSPKSAS